MESGGFLIAIGILIVVIVAIMMKGKKEKYADNKYESVEKKSEVEKVVVPKIHYSDEFKGKEPVTLNEQGHTIKTIYMYKDDYTVWICPNCEVENLSSKNRCSICNQEK